MRYVFRHQRQLCALYAERERVWVSRRRDTAQSVSDGTYSPETKGFIGLALTNQCRRQSKVPGQSGGVGAQLHTGHIRPIRYIYYHGCN